MDLMNLLASEDANEIRSKLNLEPFRRLSHRAETVIEPGKLCQAFHINRMEGDPKLILGDAEGGYYMHSVESVKPYVQRMLGQEIKRVYLGTDAVIGENGSYLNKLDHFANILMSLRRIVGDEVEIMVDPAGLCLRNDLRWGVTAEDGGINAEATLALLGQAAVTFEACGANALLTIGRANCEVEVVKKALEARERSLKVMSFSTNSETTSAYFEVTKNDILRSRTGQKILVGNFEEMIVRAICDFAEGSDVIVQKPVESLHIPAILRMLSQGLISVDSLVSESLLIESLLESNDYIANSFAKGAEIIKAKERQLKTGTYEVSGTYSSIQLLKQRYSEQLGWSMLDELLVNAASAAGSSLDIMISRNATWYMEKRKEYTGV